MLQFRSGSIRLAAVAVTLALSLSLNAKLQAMEVVVTAVTALPTKHDLSQTFLELFVKRVNDEGKGIVRVDYKGGPEVIPQKKSAQAVQRGAIDMLHSPAAYHAGITPQSAALMATNMTPKEVRANGGFDHIRGIWDKKLNTQIISWSEAAAQFYLYMVREPTYRADGTVDLTGYKVRSTGAYRALLEALGASPISMPVSDVYTALERGVVDGFGWPSVGLKALGLANAVKFRIDPPFYHLANLVLLNNDKWGTLPQAAKDILLKVGEEYELSSSKRMMEKGAEDEAAILEAGVKIIKLSGKAEKDYLDAAYGSAWKRIAKRLDANEVSLLKSKLLK
ncbi:MAG: TRAP transporter substrate-binding protein DctP [SAR324 cluster bacterium]|nr:TRAP transporter substrate-binding protein DctP [SAR324 cluster bacterium]